MKLNIAYYAVIREKTGCGDETIATNARTARELYGEISRRHGLTYPLASLKVAINHQIARWDDPLSEDDHVAFIPPVAGG